jgi:dTDP-4-dehydrorhamnose reductase
MRIAVVGARGQLGAVLVQVALERGHDVLEYRRQELDVTDERAVEAAMAEAAPDLIVNCTGYNAVDAAEDHPVEALRLNAFAVRGLARAADAQRAIFVHYSSDFVFDGETTKPYTEEDAPNPRSAYAASKRLGEWMAEETPRAYVLRVESLFGEAAGVPPKGTVAGMVKGMLEGRRVPAFADRTVSPTYVVDAANATLDLVERNSTPGLYHCVSTGWCTWLEFAQETARLLGVANPQIDAVRVADVKLRAPRPQYCALSNAKLTAAGIRMPAWRDALQRHVQKSEVRSTNYEGL